MRTGKLTRFTQRFFRACKNNYIKSEGDNADWECFILILCEMYCYQSEKFLTYNLKERLEYFRSWPYNPQIGGFEIGEKGFQDYLEFKLKNEGRSP